jgi:hypothetical protein
VEIPTKNLELKTKKYGVFVICINFLSILMRLLRLSCIFAKKLEERMMRQILLYIFILLVCSVSAEQFRITGKMVDAKGNEPLIGAIVVIKGTDRGTVTDIDGNFSIEVEKGEILKFSNVGSYSKEEEILSDSSLFIEMEENGDTIIIITEGWRPSPWRPTGPFSPVQPVKPDSLKTSPKDQNSLINH